MANKCRICGYRFKSKDEVICPECFTAREEDISCGSYSDDLHDRSHGADVRRNFSSTSENDIFEEYEHASFIDEQRKDEANDPVPSSTYNKNESSSRQQKLDALKQASAGAPQRPYRNYNIPNNSVNYNGSRPPIQNAFPQNVQIEKNNRQIKKVKGCVVGAIIIWVVIPVIVGLISAFVGEHRSESSSSRYHIADYDYSFEKPDISMPDFDGVFDTEFIGTVSEYRINVSNKTKYASSTGLNTDPNVSKYAFSVDLVDEEYENGDWQLVDIDIELIPDLLDDDRTLSVEDIVLISKDNLGDPIAVSEILGYTEIDENTFEYCRFLVPSDAVSFTLSVPTESPEYEDEVAEVKLNMFEFRSAVTESDDYDE